MSDQTSNRSRRTAAVTSPRRLAAAAVACAALFSTGCSGSDAAATTTAAPPSAPPTAVAAASAAAAAASAAAAAAPIATVGAGPTVTVVVDGPALLQQGLDAIAGGYHFDTRVTIDGGEVLVASGDRVGDGTRLTIWANGGSVAYVLTPAGSWVFPEGGEWEALDTPPSSTDPVNALRNPTSIAAVAADATTTVLAVTVPSTSLGVPTAGDSTLNVVLTSGAVSQISYTSTTNGQAAVVQSALSPVVDGTPVVAPI
jgi:hypothetical protein